MILHHCCRIKGQRRRGRQGGSSDDAHHRDLALPSIKLLPQTRRRHRSPHAHSLSHWRRRLQSVLVPILLFVLFRLNTCMGTTSTNTPGSTPPFIAEMRRQEDGEDDQFSAFNLNACGSDGSNEQKRPNRQSHRFRWWTTTTSTAATAPNPNTHEKSRAHSAPHVDGTTSSSVEYAAAPAFHPYRLDDDEIQEHVAQKRRSPLLWRNVLGREWSLFDSTNDQGKQSKGDDDIMNRKDTTVYSRRYHHQSRFDIDEGHTVGTERDTGHGSTLPRLRPVDAITSPFIPDAQWTNATFTSGSSSSSSGTRIRSDSIRSNNGYQHRPHRSQYNYQSSSSGSSSSSSSTTSTTSFFQPMTEWWSTHMGQNTQHYRWPKIQCRMEPTTTLKIRKTFRPLKTILKLSAQFNTQLGVWQFHSSWEDAIIGGKLTLAGRKELQLTKSWQLSVGPVEDLVTRLRLRAAVDLQTWKAYVRVGFRTERLSPINVMEGFSLVKQIPLDGVNGKVKLEVKANFALPEPEIEYSTETHRSVVGMGDVEVSIEELNLLLDY